MNSFLLDASALAKRYHPEIGSDRIDHLFGCIARPRLMALMLGAAEVVSVLVRRRNSGQISPGSCTKQINTLRVEVIEATDFKQLAVPNDVIVNALPFIERFSVNSNDAVALRIALDVAASLRPAGDDLVLVASDQRLLKAAQAEGLVTFDPETQSPADLDNLIGP
jgi:predicted nucleic acid-binding protein